MSAKLKYGNGPGNKILHIKEVVSGVACNCTCPDCKVKLIAKKGEKNDHHFAHFNGKECEKAPETAIHKLAKEIIETNAEIYLNSETIFQYQNSELEKGFESKRLDATIWNSEEKIFVEIIVTNDVSSEKEEYLKQTGIKTLVIDLSKVDRDILRIDLEEIVIADCSIRRIISMGKNEIEESVNKFEKVREESNQDLGWFLVFVGLILWFIWGEDIKNKLYTKKRYSRLKSKKRIHYP